jgi:hypothetical protein
MMNLQKPPNPDYLTQHFKIDLTNDQQSLINKHKKFQKRNQDQQPMVNKLHNSSIENLQR